MKKIERDYNEIYGDIPTDDVDRFQYILNNMNLSKKSREMIFPSIRKILGIKWETFDFTVYLVPKATPRPRHNIKRNVFYVSGAKDNKDIFNKFFVKQDVPMITTPCKYTCITYYPIPSSMSKVEQILAEMGLIRPISKPDVDNVFKTYSDMVQGTLLFDDSLIVEGVSKKFYSFKPRIEIHIEYMSEHDSNYNNKKIFKKKG